MHESPELAALLTQVDIDEHIPPQLYMAIAELLAWLYPHRTWRRTDSGRPFRQAWHRQTTAVPDCAGFSRA